MQTSIGSPSGFSLIETMVSMLVLTVGILGLSQAFISGVQKSSSAPYEVLATQKAAEAIESVFAARDSHTIPWLQLQNAAQGGVFVNTATPLKVAGTDGILNTADDGAIDTYAAPSAGASFTPSPTIRTQRPSASSSRIRATLLWGIT